MSTAITTPTPTLNSNLDPDDEYLEKSPSLETPRRSSETAAESAGIATSVNTPTPTVNDDLRATKEVSLVSDDTATSSESALKEAEPKLTKYSSIKSRSNPLTISREKRIQEGTPLIVKFDERVVVHTVPYWDPCGETFYDQDASDGPRGPNCCAVL